MSAFEKVIFLRSAFQGPFELSPVLRDILRVCIDSTSFARRLVPFAGATCIFKQNTNRTGGPPGMPVNRVGLPAGSRKRTPVRAEARPFRAESGHGRQRNGREDR